MKTDTKKTVLKDTVIDGKVEIEGPLEVKAKLTVNGVLKISE